MWQKFLKLTSIIKINLITSKIQQNLRNTLFFIAKDLQTLFPPKIKNTIGYPESLNCYLVISFWQLKIQVTSKK